MLAAAVTFLAVLCFVLAIFGVGAGWGFSLIAVGLALFALGFLIYLVVPIVTRTRVTNV